MAGLLFHGERMSDGKIVHIMDVPQGIKCNCICGKCKKVLISKQGKKNIWHFAHYESLECKYAGETALHLFAKQIIADSGEIRMPDQSFFYFESAIKEKVLPGMVADILLCGASGELIIEIFVSHMVTPEKKNKITRNSIRAMEIDLSDVDRNIGYEDLRKIIIGEVETKSIIGELEIVSKPNISIDFRELWILFGAFLILICFLFIITGKRRRKGKYSMLSYR